MPQPKVQGRFVWEELLTESPASAAQFYPKVTGWRIESSQIDPAYTVFAARSGPVGGMMTLAEEARISGARAHWLPYIGAQDVDATIAAAERLGARTLKSASTAAGVGRYAVLADPGGASFGLYAPENPQTREGTPTPGEFSWHELATGDIEAAFDFYRELFGWQVMQRMNMGPAGTYLVFGWDGGQRGGIYKLSEDSPVPYWLAYTAVPDADAAAQAALAAGGRVGVGPMDVPGGGRIAQLLDPSGVLFAVHTELRAATAAGAGSPARTAARPRRPAPSPARPSLPASAPAEKAPAGARAPRQAAPRPVKASARKAAAKKTAKRAAKKVAKKAAKKVAKKAAKKAARKAAAKRGARRRARPARTKSARRGRTAAARRTTRRGAAKRAAKRRAGGGHRGAGRRSAGRRRRR